MTRVAVFVDGFNLYFGLRHKHGRKYLWLDLQRLATSLLRADQQLVSVHYFTTRISGPMESVDRQSRYLDALAECPLVSVHAGRFQQKDQRCRACGSSWRVFEEKETDVNIAIALLSGAIQDTYDTALLISGDSDLCPAARAISELFSEKRVIAAFPPGRHSRELQKTVHGHLHIGLDKIRHSQLPEVITTDAGITIKRPETWV